MPVLSGGFGTLEEWKGDIGMKPNIAALPYRVGPEFMGGVPIYLPDNRHFITVMRATGIDAIATAHYVVNCANLHPELVKSLSELLRSYENALDGNDWHKRDQQLLDECRAILTQAREA